MWYVIQVRTGTEENIRTQCQKRIPPEILERAFIPYYEERRHIRGEWTTLQRVLFPGYVFLVSPNSQDLFFKLKGVIGLTKLIGAGNEIIPLREEEIAFLQGFGGEDQVVTVSEGIIIDSEVKIYSGPLMGMEGKIRKIDRHKRKAWIEVQMFGRMQLVQVGLEIVAKVKREENVGEERTICLS